MGRRVLWVMAAALVVAGAAAVAAAENEAKQVTPAMRITEVTVFPSSANVTRMATLEGEPGEYELTLSRLPDTFDGSVMARVTGEGRIVDVRVVEKKVEKLSDQVRQAKREELEKMDGDLLRLADELRTVESRISFMDQLRTAWTTPHGRGQGATAELVPPTVEQAEAALKFFEEYNKFYILRRDNQAASKKLTAQRAILQTELSSSETAQNLTEKIPVIRVAKFDRLPVKVLAEYRVGGASWSPAYDLRAVDAKAVKVDLVYYAELAQKTGEDWSGVKITFSTAKTSEGLELPVLAPLAVAQRRTGTTVVGPTVMEDTIPYKEPSARFGPPGAAILPLGTAPKFDLSGAMTKGGGGGGGGLFSESSPGAGSEVIRKKEVEDRKQAASFSTQEAETYATFTAPGVQTIPSSDTPRRLMVLTASLPMVSRLVALPRLSGRVYLTGEFTNESGLPLLQGIASIYVGNDYVGTMLIPSKTDGSTQYVDENAKLDVGAKQVVSFGALNGFKVTRKKVSITDGSSGMFGNRRKVDYEIQIRIQNLTKEAREVEVQESLPTAQQKEISISVKGTPEKEVSYDSAKRLRENNIRTWPILAPPGEDKAAVIKYQYSVEWDKDQYLYGALD